MRKQTRRKGEEARQVEELKRDERTDEKNRTGFNRSRGAETRREDRLEGEERR